MNRTSNVGLTNPNSELRPYQSVAMKAVQQNIHALHWMEQDGKLLSVPEHIKSDKE